MAAFVHTGNFGGGFGRRRSALNKEEEQRAEKDELVITNLRRGSNVVFVDVLRLAKESDTYDKLIAHFRQAHYGPMFNSEAERQPIANAGGNAPIQIEI